MTTFPHILDPAPRSGRVKKPQPSRRHLEVVFMSRLIVSGLPPSARGLVRRILHHGFYHGHTVTALEVALGRSRRLILHELTKYNLPTPSRWLAVCRLLYVIWIHFRLRGSFREAVKYSGCGTEISLHQLCKKLTRITPGQAHRECLEANSILPFMDRCIPYLKVAATELLFPVGLR